MTGRATAIDCARLVLWHMWGSAAVRTHIVTANALYRLLYITAKTRAKRADHHALLQQRRMTFTLKIQM